MAASAARILIRGKIHLLVVGREGFTADGPALMSKEPNAGGEVQVRPHLDSAVEASDLPGSCVFDSAGCYRPSDAITRD